MFSQCSQLEMEGQLNLFIHRYTTTLDNGSCGCLQSIYGVHTFRVESIAHGKAAPVDELQVQGVSDPDLLRKVIITEASKICRDVSKSGKPFAPSIDVENMARMPSTIEGSVVLRSPSKSHKGEAPAFFVDDLQDGSLNGLELKNGTCKSTTMIGEKKELELGHKEANFLKSNKGTTISS